MPICTAQHDLLVVPEGARIPKVCLKCGATKDVARHPRAYPVGAFGAAPWVGGGLGAVVANAVRTASVTNP